MNPSAFILNSDFPIDKVVYFYEFSDVMPERNSPSTAPYSKYIVCDGITEPLLFIGIYATKPDFSDSMAIGGDSLSNEDDTPAFSLTSGGNGDCTVLINQQANNLTAATKVYFRLYGFTRTSSVKSFKPTQRSSGKLLLNTDYLYLPMIFSGELNTTTAQVTEIRSINVEHAYAEVFQGSYWKIRIKYPKSGLLPIVKIWMESLGAIVDVIDTSFIIGTATPSDPVATIDEDESIIEINLRRNRATMRAQKLHIRIWAQ